MARNRAPPPLLPRDPVERGWSATLLVHVPGTPTPPASAAPSSTGAPAPSRYVNADVDVPMSEASDPDDEFVGVQSQLRGKKAGGYDPPPPVPCRAHPPPSPLPPPSHPTPPPDLTVVSFAAILAVADGLQCDRERMRRVIEAALELAAVQEFDTQRPALQRLFADCMVEGADR